MTASLLHRVAAGDSAAVGECIDRYGGLVWALARRMSATPADAEDAAQEIFVDLWRHASRFDPARASEDTFVAMIARRRLIDRLRRSGRRPPAGALGSPDEPGAEPVQQARAEQSEDSGRALDALAGLSSEQQRMIRLAVLHGWSHEAIATSTGLPLGTVKTHIRRGLLRLRDTLDPAARTARGVTP